MSYSRWGDSRFYTFWTGNSKIRDEQIFDIMFSMGRELTFTFKELREDMNGCLDKCEEFLSKEYKWQMRKSILPPSDEFTEVIEPPQPFQGEERGELKSYMKEFVKDIKYQFKKKL